MSEDRRDGPRAMCALWKMSCLFVMLPKIEFANPQEGEFEMSKENPRQPRPAQYVEHKLLTAILNGTYGPGASLPGERLLAEQMGVTRPTLRETLQRLSRDGWITIQHGKSTVVNDYWRRSGLSLLGTMAKYGEYLPSGFVGHILQVRDTLLPTIAGLAVEKDPEAVLRYLDGAERLDDTPIAYAVYDWDFQMLLSRCTGNPVFSMVLNDFAPMFRNMAVSYFREESAREISMEYYLELKEILRGARNPGISVAVERVVKRVLEKVSLIWIGG